MSASDKVTLAITTVLIVAALYGSFKFIMSDMGDRFMNGCSTAFAYFFLAALGLIAIGAVLVGVLFAGSCTFALFNM